METIERIGAKTLRQLPQLLKLGTDSVRLAAFATLRSGSRVLDLGCGTGALLVLLSERGERLTLDGIELVPEAAELCRRNLVENQLTGTVLQGDMREKRWFSAGHYDLVISNPPYFPAGTGLTASGSRGTARSELACTLADVCGAAGPRLKTGGRFAVCCRPERLPELFEQMRRSAIEPKRLQLVQGTPENCPKIALIEGIRQGRPGLKVEPTLILSTEKAR